MARLNGAALRAGVLLDAAILVLAAVIGRAGGGTAPEAIGVLLAPFAGGAAAGRRARTTPLTHGAATAMVVAVAFVVIRVGDAAIRSRPLHPASVIILVILSTVLGFAGGLVGPRVGRPPLADSGS